MRAIGIDDVTARLREHDLPSGVLDLPGGGRLLVSQRGGRLMPFLPSGESALWLSPALLDADGFDAFLRRDDWNLGGERIWIAPEIQFTIRDRRDFWGSYALPAAMDPGSWTLECLGDDAFALRQEAVLSAFNLASGTKRVAVRRQVRPAPDPLRSGDGVVDGVAFIGYEHDVELRDLEPNAIAAQAWNLIQLIPGGWVLLPTLSEVTPRAYFEPVRPEHVVSTPDALELAITGAHRYKLGVDARAHLGRLAYLRRLDGTRACLMVRSFFNNPSSAYLEQPADRPGESGDSIHVYNDDGGAGGFGEIECYGQAIGGAAPRRTAAADTTVLWIYVGGSAAITEVARRLLGERAGRRATARVGGAVA
jgi:hypothetical protein